VAWRRVIEAQLPCALILEDDACLSRTLPAFLNEASPLMSALDLIRIETGRRRVRVAPARERLACGVALQRAHSGQWGTAGYLISGRCAARMLDEPRLFDLALDDVFFDPQGPAFAALDWRQCAPGLCIQGDQLAAPDAPGLWRSDVTIQRRQRRAADPERGKAKGWRAKLAREAGRLRRQGGLALAEARDFFAHGVRWTTIRFRA
jgi:GR25 family glycosyltransferase involved in LPS biosynthesis